MELKDKGIEKNNNLRKIVKPSSEELELHKRFLKDHLQKNYFN